MTMFFGIIFSISLICTIVLLVERIYFNRVVVKRITLAITIGAISFCLFIPLSIAGTVNNNDQANEVNSKQQKEDKKQEAKEAAQKKKEENKEKEEQKDQDNLEEANYLGYKYMLEDVPKNTNYWITKAYMDKDHSYNTTIWVNNQISALSGDELKRYVKVVFDKVKKLEDGYEPNKQGGASRIIINDNGGNRLAHSSFFTRSIKYDFE